MALPVIVAPLVGWLAGALGVVGEVTLGSILRAAVAWFVKVIATKFIAKVLFFAVFMGLVEFMPDLLVWLFGAIGDAVLTIIGTLGEKLSDNLANRVDTSEAETLFNSNIAAMPDPWRQTMAYLNITPLIGLIISTYSSMFAIDCVNAVYKTYTAGLFANGSIVQFGKKLKPK